MPNALNAEVMEGRATGAIDYAISAVEQAKLTRLDAILARLDAEAAKSPSAVRSGSYASSNMGAYEEPPTPLCHCALSMV